MAKHLEAFTTPPPQLQNHEPPPVNPNTLLGSILEKNLPDSPTMKTNIHEPPLGPKTKTSLYSRLKTTNYNSHQQSQPPLQLPPQLAGLSHSQILEERCKLLSKIKPETLEFLQKRKLEREATKKPTTTQQSVPKAFKLQNLPIDPGLVQNVPHMNTLEPEKLRWVGNIELSQGEPSGATVLTGERSARFNFNGQIITVEMERELKTWDQGLHHHGEEMERPGYTLDELFILARSINFQQRGIGLSILSNILKRAHAGEFDLVLSKSIFEIFLELDTIYTLRIGLDNPDSSALNASLDCLGSLVHPDMEESCLDYSYFWSNPSQPQPLIRTKEQRESQNRTSPSAKSDKEQEEVSDSELKDSEYLQLDLLDFLIVRTDLLDRISYVLQNYAELLNEPGVVGILKICTRLARHSPNLLTQHPHLLGLLFNYYMNPNHSTLRIGTRASNLVGIPLGAAVKVFRILISSSKANAEKLNKDFDFFVPILSYLSYDSWMEQNKIMEVEALVLESFKLWHAFLRHGIGIEEFSRFFPVIFKCLQMYTPLESMGSFDLSHMTHVFGLIWAVLDKAETFDHLVDLISFVEHLVLKMCFVLSRSEIAHLLDFDSGLGAIGLGLSVLKLYMDKCQEAGNKKDFCKLNGQLQKFAKSPGYSRISENCVSHSLLLCRLGNSNKESSPSKYPENMYPSSAYLFGGDLVPIMVKGTPFPMLSQLFHFVQELDSNLRDYICKLIATPFPIRANYYVRYELNFLSQMTKLPTSILYRLVPQVQTGDGELLCLLLRKFFEQNETILTLYRSVLEPDQDENLLEFKDTSRKIVPVNWFYRPFHAMNDFITDASSIQSLTKVELEKIYAKVLKDSQLLLEFVIAVLKKHKNRVLVGSRQELQMFYLGICRIFLSGNNIFLDPTIQTLLVEILTLLLSCELIRMPNNLPCFTHKTAEGDLICVPGTEDDFTTFYVQLMAVYSECSYGNSVFGDYLLLPLRSNEQMNVRKKFWTSETMRFIRTKIKESVIPLEEYFGHRWLPPEHPEMLTIYQKLLGIVNPSTHELLREILKICSLKVN